ncbi:hypothetical protein [Croceivirga sp. JEA036]|uniref:TraG/VirB4 family ATPase n=1 Tax=Croceivirga sp. JEA036 TaxID=2721162 RepID=UPI00143A1C7E|nr:hypothetical protein [Croceivirga sp. JEA036]NJB38093.1 hypothetical protein [Croceivirga sp. JEA036]
MNKALLIKDETLPIHGIESDVLISKEKGCLSYGFKVSYPAIYQKDIGVIEQMSEVLESIFSVLEKDYLIHKQDWFFNQDNYNPEPLVNESAMQRYNRIHFTGRKVRKQFSYLFITKVPSNYIAYSASNTNAFLYRKKTGKAIEKDYITKKELDVFMSKRDTITRMLQNKHFNAKELKAEDYIGKEQDVNGLLGMFKDFDPTTKGRDKIFKDNSILIGGRELRFYTLQNNEQLTDVLQSSSNSPEKEVNGKPIAKSLISPLGLEYDKDHVLNQYFFVPDQERALEEMQKKLNRIFNYTHRFNPIKAIAGDEEVKKPKNLETTGNDIFMNDTSEFVSEVIEKGQKFIFSHVNIGLLDGTYTRPDNFKLDLRENTVDLHDLYFASCPGNAIGLPNDLYMPLTSGAAVSLAYFEDYSKGNAPFGQRVIDVASGNPIYWDFFTTPYKNKTITNLNAWGVGKSGSGKSYSWNSILNHQYEMGHHIFNIDGSSSFERATKYHNGVFFKVSMYEKIGFNPFLLSSGNEEEINSKRVFLAYFLCNLLESAGEEYSGEILFGIFSATVAAYYKNVNHDLCFNSFFDFFKAYAPSYVKDNGIERSIKLNEIIFLLREYYKGGVYDYLLNNRDERLAELMHQRYITFQIKELKDDPKLFTNTTFLLTNLYKEKLYNPELLKWIKFLHYDESWTAMDKPVLANFILDTIKTVRSQNGSTIFTSQDIEDFFKSPIIKNTVINNSEIGLISDLSTYKGKAEYVRDILGITDSQANRIFGLHRNMPQGIKAKEIAVIYAKEHLHTFGIETSREEAAIYESSPTEKERLAQIDANYHSMKQTAKAFAGN